MVTVSYTWALLTVPPTKDEPWAQLKLTFIGLSAQPDTSSRSWNVESTVGPVFLFFRVKGGNDFSGLLVAHAELNVWKRQKKKAHTRYMHDDPHPRLTRVRAQTCNVCLGASILRPPLDSVVEKARGFEPPREIFHCTCHPCPPRRRNSLGGEITGYRLGTTGIQIPARQKIFKKIRKNEDFKNTREHRFISHLVITIGFR